jgi:hypothetical protein
MAAAAGTAAAPGLETRWVGRPFECHGRVEPPDHYDRLSNLFDVSVLIYTGHYMS